MKDAQGNGNADKDDNVNPFTGLSGSGGESKEGNSVRLADVLQGVDSARQELPVQTPLETMVGGGCWKFERFGLGRSF